MSNYFAPAIHPETGEVQHDAQWLDDRFGPHVYGVVFSDGKVFDERKVDVPDFTCTKCYIRLEPFDWVSTVDGKLCLSCMKKQK